MKITAKELAEKLNLSPAAVSIALNGRHGVSTETRKRVLDAAEKYGYDFTRISEKKRASGTVYFCIYKKHGAVVGDTPFFSQVSEGIASGCKKAEFRMKVTYLYEDSELEREIEEIQFSDCVGMILLGTEMMPEDYTHFSHLPFPVIFLDTSMEGIACDCVLMDNVLGAFQAVSHLIKRTRCQPGYLHSFYPISNFNERQDGFYKALRTHGLSTSSSIVHRLPPSMDGAYSDMLELLKAGTPTASAYFADNDWIALGAMKAFKKMGYRIPDDVAVVGFDDIPFCTVIEPSLTTIRVPKQSMGEAAVSRLITRLEQPGAPMEKIRLGTELVRRRSVAAK
ncbi:MAG: LacI family transcriptional regulator [Ruminococcus sp.]|nr:LacI family transcriptional regulator [Ruminococcus sp.]